MEGITDAGLRSLLKIENPMMIHFCLLGFNEPIVPIKAFPLNKLNETIEEITREKLTQNLLVSTETKEVKIKNGGKIIVQIWLPKLVTQYSSDFGTSPNDALKMIGKYIDAKFQHLLNDKSLKVYYQKKV